MDIGCANICAMVKSRYIGDGHPTFNRNPYNGYINLYYWVDDHPLLYGNNGSLDPGTYPKSESLQLMLIVFKVWRVKLTLWLFCTGPRVWRTYTETYDIYETSDIYIYIYIMYIYITIKHTFVYINHVLVDQMDGTTGISILTLRVSLLTLKFHRGDQWRDHHWSRGSAELC